MADLVGSEKFEGEIATFNPAALENKDFYDDVIKSKYLMSMVEQGDYEKAELLYAVLKNARRHFWFKIHPNFQRLLIETEENFKKQIEKYKILKSIPVQKEMYRLANDYLDKFFVYKSMAGLSIRFAPKPMTADEMLDKALGLEDIPLKLRHTIQGLGARVAECLKNDWDSVVAITGMEGVGKSHLAAQLAWCIDNRFKLDTHVAFVPNEKQIFDMITKLPKGSPVVLDEAIKAFYKLNWQNRLQIMLNELLTLCRNENKATILCIPNILDLNKLLRGRRVCLWLHVVKRGRVACFCRDTNPFILDPWHFDNVEKQIKEEKVNFSKLKSKYQLNFLRKLPNFLVDIPFDKMAFGWATKYEELKSQNRYDDMVAKMEKGKLPKKDTEREQKALLKFIKILRAEGNDWIKIENFTGIPASTMQSWVTRAEGLLVNPLSSNPTSFDNKHINSKEDKTKNVETEHI